MDLQVPSSKTMVTVGALFCLLNIVLVLALAGGGVLKVVQPGDITYLESEQTPEGQISAPNGGPMFVVERPTDVDAFFDAVLRVRSGGPLFNPWGSAETIQRYHYHPFALGFFLPWFFLGYLGFKVTWLIVSLAATAFGSYLILQAESVARGLQTDSPVLPVLAVLSVGFAPMVSNFKVGQTSPIMYFFIAAAWWFARTRYDGAGGLALVGAAIFKPYSMTPLVLWWNRSRWRGILGFVAGVGLVNFVSVGIFGVGTTLEYYRTLFAFAVEQSAGSSTPGGLDKWWSNSLRMFFWLGPLSVVARLALTVPFAYLTAVHVFDDETTYEPPLFALSLISVLVLVPGTSVIDLALVLGAVIVLGYEFYAEQPRALAGVVIAFLMMHGHPYFMEATVGWGAENIAWIPANEQLVLTVVPLLQPGMYGLLLLLGLSLYAVYLRAGGFPRVALGAGSQG